MPPIILIAALLWGVDAVPAPQTAVVTVCSGMAGPISSVSLNGPNGASAEVRDLKPGACAALPVLPPGAYTLTTIESDGTHTMQCRRDVVVKGGETFRIARGDGASCMM
jgi:hypothetical protein